MNGNIGDGRTSVDGDENFKGIGPTGMVNPYTEEGHNSGTLKIDHAILESVWSKLLDLELPYGANRVRGILGTGTIEDREEYPGLRVVIVRDDFLRPAHFILNETSSKVGRTEIDRSRVRQPKGGRHRHVRNRCPGGKTRDIGHTHRICDRIESS